ncbi:MAG: radical SAM protein [Deltaproteobacteria bacterium]|nr:radical SAM protein [Deltaproteobacteria bacterium]
MIKLAQKYIEDFKQKKRAFWAFQIEPTSRCQLRCVVCPRACFLKEWESRDMPISSYMKISRYFQKARYVHLQGWGEPLLHPNLFEMVKIAKSAGCKVSITTNGQMLNSENSKRLVAEGIDIVTISVAGASQGTHGFIRTGSDLKTIFENVKWLSNYKKKIKTEMPRIHFSYIMTKTNLGELPEFLRIAKGIGVQEVVATNLDYTPTLFQDDLKIFSGKETNRFQKHIKKIEKTAARLRLPLRIYPLVMQEEIVCELDPLRILFISSNGTVSPCVYLNLPIDGMIPRIFCGTKIKVPQLSFGNINSQDLIEIWDNREYREFRKNYVRRAELLAKAYKNIDFDLFGTMDRMKKAEREVEKGLKVLPLPSSCRTCYKAYGI